MIDLDEYFNSEDIHECNKNLVKTTMKNRGLKLELFDYFSSSNIKHAYYF